MNTRMKSKRSYLEMRLHRKQKLDEEVLLNKCIWSEIKRDHSPNFKERKI